MSHHLLGLGVLQRQGGFSGHPLLGKGGCLKIENMTFSKKQPEVSRPQGEKCKVSSPRLSCNACWFWVGLTTTQAPSDWQAGGGAGMAGRFRGADDPKTLPPLVAPPLPPSPPLLPICFVCGTSLLPPLSFFGHMQLFFSPFILLFLGVGGGWVWPFAKMVEGTSCSPYKVVNPKKEFVGSVPASVTGQLG